MKSAQIAGRNAVARHQDQRLLRHQRHRREIGRAVIRRLLVQQLHLRVGRHAAEHELIAVGLRLGDARRAGHAAGAGNIFDDDLLAQLLRKTRRVDAPQGVIDAARRKRHHHRHRPLRPVLGRGRRREGRARERSDETRKNASQKSCHGGQTCCRAAQGQAAPAPHPDGTRGSGLNSRAKDVRNW